MSMHFLDKDLPGLGDVVSGILLGGWGFITLELVDHGSGERICINNDFT